MERERTPSDNEAKEDDDLDGEVENDQKNARENEKSQATDSLKRKKKKKKRKPKESKVIKKKNPCTYLYMGQMLNSYRLSVWQQNYKREL